MSNVFQNIQLERIADAMQGGGSSVTVNIDVTGAGDMQGATASAAGAHGLVPAPQAGDENKVLSGAGAWIDAGSGGELGDLEDVTITSPTSGESLKFDGAKWVNGNVTAELPDVIEETSGNMVTVEAAERPAKSLVVAINPVQSGSGDPSPENVRPITGWTECNVVVSPTKDNEDGTTYTIEFKDGDNPLTVYGGTLDVLSGVLTVDRAYVVFDGSSDESWRMHGALASWFYIDNALTNAFTDASASNFALSNAYKQSPYSTSASIENGKFAMGYSAGSNVLRTAFKDTRYTTVKEWTNAVATNHIQLCYKLATPITYQLTPTVVQMLLGTNNIWADTGEVKELKYIPQTYNDLLKEVSGGISYSLAEQDTGLKWIDGSTIYQRTFDISGATYSQDQYIEIATVPNIALLISAECVVYEGSTGTLAPEAFQRIHVTGTGAIEIYCTTSSWNLTAGSHLTVRYTKSAE